MNKADIIIIGGGVSGLTAALRAAFCRTKKIIILEHKSEIGKKLMATGNGRCNFTNEIIDKNSYRGNEPDFAYNIIKQFSQKDLILLFKQLGIAHTSINGYYYPRSLQATTVLRSLEYHLKEHGVETLCNVKAISIKYDKQLYTIHTNGETYCTKYLVLATGGKSYSSLGSDGSGYRLAEQLGHSITKCYPSLTGLKATGVQFNQCKGVRCKGAIRLYINRMCVYETKGEIQYTEYGLSGIPIFELSRVALSSIGQGKVTLVIDSIPEETENELTESFKELIHYNEKKRVVDLVNAYIPSKLAKTLLQANSIDPDLIVKKIHPDLLFKIVKILKGQRYCIIGDCGYEKSQVTAGGIMTSEVDVNTLESKITKNLYLLGELLDIDGNCGGYNLHFAFATGMLAGKALARKE